MVRRVKFEKLNGAGNDFVFIEDFEDRWDVPAQEVVRLCDRHFGIGADGVIVVKPPKDAGNAGFMHYVNADGSIAQMCGNGVRCFAKYLVDHGLAEPGETGIAVETRAGVKVITVRKAPDGTVCEATVDMGAPIFDPALVPAAIEANSKAPDGTLLVQDADLESPFGVFAFTCVSMGNPHAVTFVEDWKALDDALFTDPGNKCLATFDAVQVGAYYESCSAFPEKANIEFASVEPDGIHMRVFERGCGETLACGTGACATGVAAYVTGRAGAENDLHLLGGTLHIAYDGQRVLMTGPAAFSFQGDVDCELLER